MRYSTIEPSFFVENRKQLTSMLPDKTLIVFHSNPIYPTNADGVLPFKQNSDLFYFSGIDQEETILLLCPHASNPAYREILFILESNEQLITWEGYKLTKKQASELSGITTILWTSEFDKIVRQLAIESTGIALLQNEHMRSENHISTLNDLFVERCKKTFPLHPYNRLAPLCAELRVKKKSQEVEQLKKAVRITYNAFLAAARTLQPGCKEYEIEAIIQYHFLKNGSRGPAYASIIASGNNANVLHYTQNDMVCQSGDLVLMDFGAEYGNYNADLTRVLPVDGTFTERQKAYYEGVLRIFKEVKKEYKPGKSFKELNQLAGSVCTEVCLDLGIVTKEEVQKKPLVYRKYFMHGIGHHLGLDVHDVHPVNHILEPGMILTLEPGIYNKEEGIGIRLENDILITETGCEDLMDFIPLEIKDIEDIMA